MRFQELKESVLQANLALVKAGLVLLTWGNASAVDRATRVMAIKPSGVAYKKMKASDMVVVSLDTGRVVDGNKLPSSDTPTHFHLYREFAAIGSIAHTHSTYGTIFAQAMRPIPCLGTTHADHFYGDIPVTRQMTPEEVQTDYELNTGRVIVECFRKRRINPVQVPGVLVAGHAPFAWGPTPEKAVENAMVLESAAHMAMHTYILSPTAKAIRKYLLDKHFLRKHGPGAYYGQLADREKEQAGKMSRR